MFQVMDIHVGRSMHEWSLMCLEKIESYALFLYVDKEVLFQVKLKEYCFLSLHF